jgi:formate hydrogenlyase transcriptional activator
MKDETGRESEILLEIASLAVRTKTHPELFERLAPHIQQLTGCDLVNFSLYDSKQNGMVTYYWTKERESGEIGILSVAESLSGKVWTSQKPLLVSDLEAAEPRGCVPFLREHGVRSHSVLPLTTAQHRFGALGVGKRSAGDLESRNPQALDTVAQLTALALENQKIRHSLAETQAKLESLVSMSLELSATLELDRLLPTILETLRSLMHHDYTVLALLEADHKTLRMHAVDAPEWDPLLRKHNLVPLEQAASAGAIESRQAIVFTAERLSKLNSPFLRSLLELGIESLCCVPLLAEQKALGSLNLGSKRQNAFTRGDVDYLQELGNHIAAALHNAQRYGEVRQLKDRLVLEKHYLENEIRTDTPNEIVGRSPTLQRVLDNTAIVAGTSSTVLITGETGTGKEQIARTIHVRSQRANQSFIKLNCAAIPTGLLESELFGHEKGAFTGAVTQKVGRLELADKGTLFLDEIGEIPLELQPKLLRVLQDQEFERLGGTRTIKVDIRLLAATNRDLGKAVEEKQFRRDLFYRLRVFPVHLPALRERREDIPLLVRYFVDRCAARMRKRIEYIPDEAIEVMMNWSWPGNIRELENFIERSMILSEGNVLRAPLSELQDEISRARSGTDSTLAGREREYIIEVLRQTRGMISGPDGAAARLGMKRTSLQYKMQRLGISKQDYM